LVKSKVLEEVYELRNSPRKAREIHDISRNDLKIENFDGFRKRLQNSKKKNGSSLSSHHSEEDGQQSARFGFVHPNNNNSFSDKNLNLNR
jgi:hypothetical protein